MLAAVLAIGVAAAGSNGERLVERVKASVFTIEVHSGGSEAKSVLGSGYLVSRGGLVVTNYHVVGSYVSDPSRFQIRAKNQAGVHAARLVCFDIFNDLALLAIPSVEAKPIPLADKAPARGSPIVALGNPMGLGLSLIEGVFNGHADKGFVDRLLVSMPLNSGMSGGPILDPAGHVVGTNVAVMWLANSLSFGVPVEKVRLLLQAPAVALDEKSLRAETSRQLALIEKEAAERAVAPFEGAAKEGEVAVGSFRTRRPPAVFDCWDSSEIFKDQGVTKNRFQCNLQFTPGVPDLGEVGSVELEIDRYMARGSGFGFYGFLRSVAEDDHGIRARDPNGGDLSAPECSAERVRTGAMVWKVNTCASAFVKHPGLFHFDLVATSVSAASEGVHMRVRARGFRTDSFLALVRSVLGSGRMEAAR
jgi:serine protease Do